ncbi:serine/arginine repetitive matrix protein 1 [Eucalyptus grandis]|uniref:serine/arginine repetitive matrix protein 1 n=1 Tax=Eucalyptus grandis TaxID=71139 RepID=UPI00192EA1F2|nr:serine/arginine repetitive matrix protein 1 [Eucalyptus grandis]
MASLTSIDISYNELEGPLPNIPAFRNATIEVVRGNKGLCGFIAGCLLTLFLVVRASSTLCRRVRKTKASPVDGGNENPWAVWSFDGRMVYENIIEATEEFDAKYCIGVGGQGCVYKAQLQTGETVAFLESGSLKDVLSNKERITRFDWNKRVKVVKGVAHALSYMHHECSPLIIHRDISSKNILLDEEYEAHVSDFGMAKVLNPYAFNWTSFGGTFGYAAPELAYTMKPNEKCDVYSFKVVTLEVIMGRHPGDLISALASSSSSSSSNSMASCPLKDILDQRIPNPEGSSRERNEKNEKKRGRKEPRRLRPRPREAFAASAAARGAARPRAQRHHRRARLAAASASVTPLQLRRPGARATSTEAPDALSARASPVDLAPPPSGARRSATAAAAPLGDSAQVAHLRRPRLYPLDAALAPDAASGRSEPVAARCRPFNRPKLHPAVGCFRALRRSRPLCSLAPVRPVARRSAKAQIDHARSDLGVFPLRRIICRRATTAAPRLACSPSFRDPLQEPPPAALWPPLRRRPSRSSARSRDAAATHPARRSFDPSRHQHRAVLPVPPPPAAPSPSPPSLPGVGAAKSLGEGGSNRVENRVKQPSKPGRDYRVTTLQRGRKEPQRLRPAAAGSLRCVGRRARSRSSASTAPPPPRPTRRSPRVRDPRCSCDDPTLAPPPPGTRRPLRPASPVDLAPPPSGARRSATPPLQHLSATPAVAHLRRPPLAPLDAALAPGASGSNRSPRRCRLQPSKLRPRCIVSAPSAGLGRSAASTDPPVARRSAKARIDHARSMRESFPSAASCAAPPPLRLGSLCSPSFRDPAQEPPPAALAAPTTPSEPLLPRSRDAAAATPRAAPSIRRGTSTAPLLPVPPPPAAPSPSPPSLPGVGAAKKPWRRRLKSGRTGSSNPPNRVSFDFRIAQTQCYLVQLLRFDSRLYVFNLEALSSDDLSYSWKNEQLIDIKMVGVKAKIDQVSSEIERNGQQFPEEFQHRAVDVSDELY